VRVNVFEVISGNKGDIRISNGFRPESEIHFLNNNSVVSRN